MDKTKLTGGAIGILTILSLVLASNLIAQENVYTCLEREIAMVCDKLSQANAEGIQTRCYFNDGVKDTYKVCKSGWVKFENIEPVNIKEINFTDFTDFECGDAEFIKECRNKEGQIILRVKAE